MEGQLGSRKYRRQYNLHRIGEVFLIIELELCVAQHVDQKLVGEAAGGASV